MGYRGAAWVRLIAEAAMVVWSYTLCRKHYPIPYDLKRIGEYFAAAAVVYCASEYAFVGLSPKLHMTFNALLFIAAIVYAVWREKIDIKGLTKAVIGKFIR
jgi:hypothetical protein